MKNQLVSLTKEDQGKLKERFLEQAESHFATLDKDSPFKNISKEELREAFEEVVEPRFTTKQNDPAWYTSLLKVGIKTFAGWSVLLLPVFFFVAWINWPKKEK